jgi:hypothetical protein
MDRLLTERFLVIARAMPTLAISVLVIARAMPTLAIKRSSPMERTLVRKLVGRSAHGESEKSCSIWRARADKR